MQIQDPSNTYQLRRVIDESASSAAVVIQTDRPLEKIAIPATIRPTERRPPPNAPKLILIDEIEQKEEEDNRASELRVEEETIRKSNSGLTVLLIVASSDRAEYLQKCLSFVHKYHPRYTC